MARATAQAMAMAMSGPPSPGAPPRVALIGFGEAGESFARSAAWQGRASGWDRLEGRRAAMAPHGVIAGEDAAGALAGAAGVLSLVTADQALRAALDHAPHLPGGALWCDMNSVAPGTKQAAARAVTAAGGRYVDVAVMAPVDQGLAVPLLLAGPDAEAAAEFLAALGFADLRVVGAQVGQASAIKLCRSVMVKGLEALTAEMVLAAAAAGVLDEVLASLDASERPLDWRARADYNLDRMLQHGTRRAAEMAEARAMLAQLETPCGMTGETVLWQERLGALGLAGEGGTIPDGLCGKLAAIGRARSIAGEPTR